MSDLRYRIKKMFTLNKELVKKLEQLSDQTRIPQSRLIDEAIEDILKKYQGSK
jgi:predicted transcriptional regulator